MLDDCVFNARFLTTVSACAAVGVMLWMINRWRPLSESESLWRVITKYPTRTFLTAIFVIVYFTYILLQSKNASASLAIPPDIAFCILESAWQRVATASFAMMTWMVYVAQPVLPRLRVPDTHKWAYATLVVIGVLIRLFAFTLFSHACITGQWTLNRIFTIITLVILPRLAEALKAPVPYDHFYAGGLGALVVLWPTVLIPVSSNYVLIIIGLTTLAVSYLLYYGIMTTRLLASDFPKQGTTEGFLRRIQLHLIRVWRLILYLGQCISRAPLLIRVHHRRVGSLIARLLLAAYGAGVGLLLGHIVYAILIAPSPLEFMRRTALSGGELLAWVGGALLGIGALYVFGTDAGTGSHGFSAPALKPIPLLGRHGQTVSLGAAYGAAGGALASTLASITIALVFIDEPTTAESRWVTVPYLTVSMELFFGAVIGALIGSVVGRLLSTAEPRPLDTSSILRKELIDVSRLRFAWVGAAHGVIGYGAPVLSFWLFEGWRNALVIALSAGGLGFLFLALFIRVLFLRFLNEELANPLLQQAGQSSDENDVSHRVFEAYKRTKVRVLPWASLSGLLCGSTIGLRLGITATIIGGDSQGSWMYLMAFSGALLGLLLSNNMVHVGPRFAASWRRRAARDPSKN